MCLWAIVFIDHNGTIRFAVLVYYYKAVIVVVDVLADGAIQHKDTTLTPSKLNRI